MSSALYPFSDFTFNNLGATGRSGPTTNTYDSTKYSWVANPAYFSLNGGVQAWTVPQTGKYTITIAGAAGGAGTGKSAAGKGRVVSGIIEATANSVLYIMVGQMGEDVAHPSGCGGGGGTFVFTSTSTPLMVAGGGGSGTSTVGLDGSTTTSGTRTGGGIDGSGGLGYSGGANGTDGSGGNGGEANADYAGGGGGGGLPTIITSQGLGGLGGNGTQLGGFGGFGGGGGGGGFTNATNSSGGGKNPKCYHSTTNQVLNFLIPAPNFAAGTEAQPNIKIRYYSRNTTTFGLPSSSSTIRPITSFSSPSDCANLIG